MNTYKDFATLNSSVKHIVALVHCFKRIYYVERTNVEHFVTRVKVNGVFTTDFTFNPLNKELEINNFVDGSEVVVEYRLFFSNLPINLPYDLDTGFVVEYDARIYTYPNFKSVMSKKDGISLIGSGNLTLINNDSELTSLFDKHIFENKTVEIYSIHSDLPLSEKKIIFKGIITGKSYSDSNISLTLKDSIYALDSQINMKTNADGTLKRICYGFIDGLKSTCTDKYDKVLSTGTVEIFKDDRMVKGIGTSFTKLAQGDSLYIDKEEYKVEIVFSDTVLMIQETAKEYAKSTFCYKYSNSYVDSNRTYLFTGHPSEVNSVQTTGPSSALVTNYADSYSVIEFNNQLKVGDVITYNNQTAVINKILLKDGTDAVIFFDRFLLIGDEPLMDISLKPVKNVFINNEEVSTESFIVDNETELKITLSSDFERNKAISKRLPFYPFCPPNSRCISQKPVMGYSLNFAIKTNPNTALLKNEWFMISDDSTRVWFFIANNYQSDIPTAITSHASYSNGDAINRIVMSGVITSTEYYRKLYYSILSKCDFILSGNLDSKNSTALTRLISENNKMLLLTSGSQNIISSLIVDAGYTTDENTLDLTKFVSIRDIITYNNITTEVIYVDSLFILTRDILNSSDSTISNKPLYYKHIDYITNDDVITANIIAKKRNPVDAVIDLLENNGLGDYIDYEVFNKAKKKIDYTLSLKLPLSFGSKAKPTLKDVIKLINNSCYGSIYVTSELKLGYDIIDSSIGDISTIEDGDVINWSYSDDNFESAFSTISNYNYTDSSNSTNKYQSKMSVLTESTKEVTQDLHLYYLKDVIVMTQRSQFVSALSSKTVKIKGSLALSLLKVGQKVFINLKKHKGVGVVSSVSSNGQTCDIEVFDLGDFVKRGAKIQPNTSVNYYDETDMNNKSFITDNGFINEEEDYLFYLIS